MFKNEAVYVSVLFSILGCIASVGIATASAAFDKGQERKAFLNCLASQTYEVCAWSHPSGETK